ncbi:MAG TPA: response regulator [Candidatus Saccharimonadales bacterium]|nr:response regulator [Candidatus Saccharimonadales bacterium]
MSPSAAAPVIVLAEDDPGIASLVAETLRQDLQAEVLVVENGALVVDAVVQSGASLLILDISMPGASGIDVYDVVRNHGALGAMPILFMTAEPDRGLATLDRHGTRDVIAKPFDLDDLVRRVRAMLPAAA